MNIGIIGTGQIGSALIRQYSIADHNVKMTNATRVEKLKRLELETGASAVSLREVANGVDVLVVSIPFMEVPNLAKVLGQSISTNTIIIDTTNYYPVRDGHIEAIENGMLESVWVSNCLGRPVVKAYNTILAGSLVQAGLPKGSASRIALPISGDDSNNKEVVASLVEDSGFDALDIGNIATSWRQQPGSPIYCTDLNMSELKTNVNRSNKNILPENRERALQFILQQNPSNWKDWLQECIANNRLIYETALNN